MSKQSVTIEYDWKKIYCVEKLLDDLDLHPDILDHLKEYRPDRVFLIGDKHFVRGDTLYLFILFLANFSSD